MGLLQPTGIPTGKMGWDSKPVMVKWGNWGFLFGGKFEPPKNEDLTSATHIVDLNPRRKSAGTYPLVNQHNYGTSPFLMGQLTITMAIFNSYFDITRGYPKMGISHISSTTNGWFFPPRNRPSTSKASKQIATGGKMGDSTCALAA